MRVLSFLISMNEVNIILYVIADVIIRRILSANNYPVEMIRKIIKSYEYFRPIETVSSSTRDGRGFSCLTYIEGFTDEMTKKISGMNSEIRYGYKIPNKTSKLFTNTKSRIDTRLKKGIVYKVNCLGGNGTKCNGVYIGESSRQLDKRLYEHRNDYKNRLKPGNKTALIKHANDHGHTFDFDNSKILNFETNWYKRRFLESSQIQLHKPDAVNYKTDTQNLNTLYCGIINKFKVLKSKEL
jgi:hypothetical protein